MKKFARFRIESLENRITPAHLTWSPPATSWNWNTPSNWIDASTNAPLTRALNVNDDCYLPAGSGSAQLTADCDVGTLTIDPNWNSVLLINNTLTLQNGGSILASGHIFSNGGGVLQFLNGTSYFVGSIINKKDVPGVGSMTIVADDATLIFGYDHEVCGANITATNSSVITFDSSLTGNSVFYGDVTIKIRSDSVLNIDTSRNLEQHDTDDLARIEVDHGTLNRDGTGSGMINVELRTYLTNSSMFYLGDNESIFFSTNNMLPDSLSCNASTVILGNNSTLQAKGTVTFANSDVTLNDVSGFGANSIEAKNVYFSDNSYLYMGSTGSVNLFTVRGYLSLENTSVSVDVDNTGIDNDLIQVYNATNIAGGANDGKVTISGGSLIVNEYNTLTPGVRTHTIINSVTSTLTGDFGSYTSTSWKKSITSDSWNLVSKGYINGKVWYDMNQDGMQNDSGVGFAGIVVKLVSSTGVLASTYTDSFGNYSLKAVLGVTAHIEFEIPSTLTIALPYQGEDTNLDSDSLFNGHTVDFTMTLEDINHIDLGAWLTDETAGDGGEVGGGG